MPSQHIALVLPSIFRPSANSCHQGLVLQSGRWRGHLTNPVNWTGGKHEQIGAYLPSPAIHRQPRSGALAAVTHPTRRFIPTKGTERNPDYTAWAGSRKCRGGSWRCVIGSRCGTKHPTKKASLLPGGVEVLFQLVVDPSHSSFAANDGTRSDGYRKREPSLVR